MTLCMHIVGLKFFVFLYLYFNRSSKKKRNMTMTNNLNFQLFEEKMFYFRKNKREKSNWSLVTPSSRSVDYTARIDKLQD